MKFFGLAVIKLPFLGLCLAKAAHLPNLSNQRAQETSGFADGSAGGWIKRTVDWPAVPREHDRVEVCDEKDFNISYVEWLLTDGTARVFFTEKITSGSIDGLFEKEKPARSTCFQPAFSSQPS